MPPSDNISVGALEVRPHERSVLVHGHLAPLSSTEFDILMMLAEHPGWVFSADQLSRDSEQGACSPESVSVLIYRLRQKLGEAGAPDVVETVRGLGYRLHSTSDSDDESSDAAEAKRGLRDACWQLHEAVLEVEHSGTPEQQKTVTDLLDQARRTAYSSLAE
jgi:DNA-binding winged helix-turn-helix (wHTH) protein